MSFEQIEERTTDDPGGERERLTAASARARAEMVQLKEKMHALAPEFDASIFDAQRMMLEDATFLGKIEAASAPAWLPRPRSSTWSRSTWTPSSPCPTATSASAPST